MSRRRAQILAVISMISFFGSTGYAAIGAFNSAMTQSSTSSTTAKVSVSADSQLLAQAKGYELVLQREPENQVALSGLVKARLQLGDGKGAIPPLEKLVKLNPKQPQYKTVLIRLKQVVNKDKSVK